MFNEAVAQVFNIEEILVACVFSERLTRSYGLWHGFEHRYRGIGMAVIIPAVVVWIGYADCLAH
ncbi:hypothetical protein [Pseudomonas sp.]|uniref:hypothetical protein n=1 Tax=Pseudomonas sp. TaxID=306 RepID=UPI0028A8105F|nr:hypothetical protein [Pseudomonas sp.]